MLSQLAKQINILGDFLGVRDIETLTAEELNKKFQIEQVDIAVLFGGSILAGGDIFAEAIKNHIAKNFIIVGGAGHTTETLRQKFNEIYSELDVRNLTEAEIFNEYIKRRYNVAADYLEKNSTNCGNNITFLLELIDEKKITCRSIILIQDSTMQLRMCAGLKKYRPEITAINYAAYQAKVIESNGELVYQDEIFGMWNIDRYVSLLLGEIPRLTDDQNGYDPQGKNFIAHVDINSEVQKAFEAVSKVYEVRKAKL